MGSKKRTAPIWLIPIVVIFSLQTVAAFLSRLIPILAPSMADEFGWDGSSIGYLSSSNSLGGLLVLIAGASAIKNIGGTRVLNVSLVVGSASMGFFLYPSMTVALIVCLVMGMSNGVANPAGSEVLQRFSPPGMRNLMFSIKQAGVPLGGMIAGLLIPAMITLMGWRLSLLSCFLIVVLITSMTWRLSAMLDGKTEDNDAKATDKKRRFSLMPTMQSLSVFKAPLASLGNNSGLLRMSIVGSLFAVPQSCWFTFTVVYLVEGLGYSLSRAGAVFAVMQIGGVLGRIAMGWLSDYLRSATLTLSVAAFFSALTTILLGCTNTSWPLSSVVLLAFVAGCSAASWNGVQIAEVARRSPSHLITETAAGGAVLVNISNIVAPSLFSMFIIATGRYDLAFYCVGACSLLVLWCLPKDKRG